MTEIMALRQIILTLNAEEREIIKLRFFENKTQCETGKAMGISQVQVSRKEKKIIEKLRSDLT